MSKDDWDKRSLSRTLKRPVEQRQQASGSWLAYYRSQLHLENLQLKG